MENGLGVGLVANHLKCPICLGKAKVVTRNYKSGRFTPTKKEIVVKGVRHEKCLNSKCKNVVLPSSEEDRIDHTISRLENHTLSSKDVKLIRKSLGVSHQVRSARFLCLSDKAFARWEKDASNMNRAYDLLLRLAARSADNLNFIKSLHKKKFKFDHSDYELVNRKTKK